MNTIGPNLLSDTLNLVQLARETARQKGSQNQADKLSPVVDQLRTLVNNERESKPAKPTGVMAGSDFQTLLSVSQKKSTSSTNSVSSQERNQMVNALSAGGMSDIDVAKQLGMTRDEVRMILNLSNMGTNGRK